MADSAGRTGRSRSPLKKGDAGAQPRGQAVQFFHAADLVGEGVYVSPTCVPGRGPLLLQSHGWLDGSLDEAFCPGSFDPSNKDTWPLVVPHSSLRFCARSGVACKDALAPRRVHMQHLREPCTKQPLLSLVFVRWGGEDPVNAGPSTDEENDGDWGPYGCPACDHYMAAVVKEGVMVHPRLAKSSFRFEAFSLFVAGSADVQAITHTAPWLATCLKGKRTTSFWMLWPVEWPDTRGSDYAAYVDRQALFGAMRACEAAGIRTGFPHPPNQYEAITSKTWKATLALDPQARLPAATHVSAAVVLSDPRRAAQQAMATLNFIRAQRSDWKVPMPSAAANKDVISKGVVKLGWSWEARYLSAFSGEEDLATKLKEMMTQQGCLASSCIVQEWVDFDFEMRLYFLPPSVWEPGEMLKPARVECNAWSGELQGPSGERRSFHKLKREDVLAQYWEDDKEALKFARKEAIRVSQHLLAWLRLVDAQPVANIRLDFMLHRKGPGQVEVVFGEYCEMGGCSLGWKEGPPTIWRAALDRALE